MDSGPSSRRNLAMPTSLVARAPNWVGDLVMATPMLEALRQSAQFQPYTILVRAHLRAILEDSPLAAHVRVLKSDREELAAYRELRPQIALLYSNSWGAAWRAFRAGVPQRAGAALSGRGWLLTHGWRPPARFGRRLPIPTAHLLRDVTGLVGVTVPDLHPRLGVREELVEAERARLERLGLARGASYVLCCPGAAFGSAKLWPAESYARTLDVLQERYGWRGVISGGPGEEALMEAVAQHAQSQPLCLAREERNLGSLKALVKGARLLLVGDSGPRWYAAAFDVPCVSIMGPNSPELTASSLEHVRIVRRADLECSPCLRKSCPLGHHRCMRELAPERVLEAIDDVLGPAACASVG